MYAQPLQLNSVLTSSDNLNQLNTHYNLPAHKILKFLRSIYNMYAEPLQFIVIWKCTKRHSVLEIDIVTVYLKKSNATSYRFESADGVISENAHPFWPVSVMITYEDCARRVFYCFPGIRRRRGEFILRSRDVYLTRASKKKKKKMCHYYTSAQRRL
jgi:hypothetical protein